MDVQAVDYDDPSEGTNAILTYSITKNAVEGSNELFSMDPAKGTIRTKVGNLDRERTSSYVIEVVATDGGGRSGE